MVSNGVVSIRVEALGVSITIADGNIAIEQTKTEIPTPEVLPKVEATAAISRQPLPDQPKPLPIAASPPDEAGTALPNSKDIPVNNAVRGNSDAGTPVIDGLEQTPDRSSPPAQNGPPEPPSGGRQAVVESLGDSVAAIPAFDKDQRPSLALRNRHGAMKRSRS